MEVPVRDNLISNLYLKRTSQIFINLTSDGRIINHELAWTRDFHSSFPIELKGPSWFYQIERFNRPAPVQGQ